MTPEPQGNVIAVCVAVTECQTKATKEGRHSCHGEGRASGAI